MGMGYYLTIWTYWYLTYTTITGNSRLTEKVESTNVDDKTCKL